MENQSTQGLRDKAEELSADLPISADMFTAVADRMDDMLDPPKEFYSQMEMNHLVMTCLMDVMQSVAKVEAQARGLELVIEPVAQ